MNGTFTRRRALALSAGAAIVTAISLGVWLTALHTHTPPGVVRVHSVHAFDVTDRATLVAWADDVFLGRVLARAGQGTVQATGGSEPAPYTLFRVQVVQSLKGPLRGRVVLRQDGGYDSKGRLWVFDDDELLQAGGEYLFVTHGDVADNPRIVNGFGDVPASDAAARDQLLRSFKRSLGAATGV